MFKAALDYFAAYRKQRIKALNNVEGQTWFTDGVKDLPELIEDKFGTDEENAALTALYTAEDADIVMMQAAHLKLDLLTGFRHDLRGQFAIGEDHEPKTAVDFDRHAVLETRTAWRRLELLDQAVQVKAKGAKAV